MVAFNIFNSILSNIILTIDQENGNICSLTASTDSNRSLVFTTSIEVMLKHHMPVMLMSDKDFVSDLWYKISKPDLKGHHISFKYVIKS